jgi:uncharacterized YccA/Bax inhibitor family protein
MNSSNPILNRAYGKRGYAAMETIPQSRVEDSLEEAYNAPAASSLRTGRMTMDDVVARTGILLGIAVTVGAASWYLNLPSSFLFIGLIGGLVTGLIGAFSKTVRPALYMTYAVFQGLLMGILSRTFELFYPGIVQQAVVATVAAFVGMLFLYKSGRLRATPKFTKVLIGATLGYLVLAMGSLISVLLGGGSLYSLSVFGPMLAMAGVALASFFLILDFDQAEQGVRMGLPQEESWRAGFGLVMTVIWLYLEILRLLAILRGGND